MSAGRTSFTLRRRILYDIKYIGRRATSTRGSTGGRQPRAGVLGETMIRVARMDQPSLSPRLHEHAAENLRFIRDTMARATDFTAVPGRGGVVMGLLACVAAIVAGPPRDTRAWLGTWLATAGMAAATGLI